MGFWGLGSTGKAAQKALTATAQQQAAQAAQEYQWAVGQQQQAGTLQDESLAYARQLMEQGLATPEQLQAWGYQLVPGTQEAITGQQANLDEIMAAYRNVPGAAATMAPLNANRDELASQIKAAQTGGQNAYQDYFNAASNDAQQRYAGLLNDTSATYGNIQNANRALWDTMAGKAGETYGNAYTDVERLNPASEFAQARVARSFAPMKAETAGRLRARGIDPNSPQGAALMTRVSSAQARGADDAAAQGIKDWLAAKTQLEMSQLADTERYGASGLAFGANAATAERTAENTLSQQQGGLLTAAQQELENQRLANANTGYTRATDWLNQGNNNALLERGMNLQDWQTGSDLNREQSTNAINALGLQQNAANVGLQYAQANQAQQNLGAGTVANASAQDYANALQAQNLGLQGQQAAQNAYGNIYKTEAANAGWGLKMLAGLGTSVAGALIPGVGAVTAAGGAVQQPKDLYSSAAGYKF